MQSALGEIIGAIGDRDFPSRAGHALRHATGFDLAAILLHRPRHRSRVIFDNFGEIGCRDGLATYARTTHRINPMLDGVRNGALRASDYGGRAAGIAETLRPYLVPGPEEELGFRTIGWPARHEEIGLYFEGWGGLIELSLYRERSCSAAPAHLLQALGALSHPIAAAFERHRTLAGAEPTPTAAAWRSRLTAREGEVCDLLLAGCSSEAIAGRLALSRHTVKDHRKAIFRKLRIGALAELFALPR
ncbi:MAG: hypothetical protein JWO65_162 [Sphingomonas bacterium]|jgi:DNA-binding CsgD family transcriptional regulator|nr:hypothetical protein [Sphingomonas bacterium]